MTLPSIGDPFQSSAEVPVPKVPVEKIGEVERKVSVKKVAIQFQAMTGLTFAEPKRNIYSRLTRRQASALRCLVEGWEQENSEAVKGRRANEQDWLRSILESVADKLGL
jgi:hypothetical protein